jgi:hypothetical protein
MSDPHRLRSSLSQSAAIKLWPPARPLRIWVELMKRKRSQAGLALNPSFTMTPLRAGTMHVSYNPIYLAQRGRFSEGMRKTGVPDG